jgi:DNA-binding NtrC family response regulator
LVSNLRYPIYSHALRLALGIGLHFDMELNTHTPSPETSARKRWILIVDDEPALQDMLATLLGADGWSVEIAGDANRALKTIESAATPPSLLICDILMPGTDGLELTRRIVARVPQIKVVLISGHLTNLSWWPTDFREYRFLSKPFSADQLLSAVREAFIDLPATR